MNSYFCTVTTVIIRSARAITVLKVKTLQLCPVDQQIEPIEFYCLQWAYCCFYDAVVFYSFSVFFTPTTSRDTRLFLVCSVAAFVYKSNRLVPYWRIPSTYAVSL